MEVIALASVEVREGIEEEANLVVEVVPIEEQEEVVREVIAEVVVKV